MFASLPSESTLFIYQCRITHFPHNRSVLTAIPPASPNNRVSKENIYAQLRPVKSFPNQLLQPPALLEMPKALGSLSNDSIYAEKEKKKQKNLEEQPRDLRSCLVVEEGRAILAESAAI